MFRSSVAFGIGFAAMLAAGWVAFPRALYSSRPQPVQFRHKMHAEKSGTSKCADCHALRDDGAFAGIPSTESCGTCHAEPMGQSKAEATLVNDFVKQHRETPWLVYSRQPANVRFSHAIHTQRGKLACTECHGLYGESDTDKKYEVNRISGYSRDIWGHSISRLRKQPHDGMKMADCEGCHRERGVEAGCLGCHQ